MYVNSAQMYYPKIYNIEMDPHEDLNVGGNYLWTMEPVFKVIAGVRGVGQRSIRTRRPGT